MINKNSPWRWIPLLYFAEGIPYFLVNTISVTMLNRMGVPNEQMALYTGALYLPWVIKPLWSPFVDILKTKRWWILSMQILMTLIFALMVITLPNPSQEIIAAKQTDCSLFTFTLFLFLATAFASATHDIAADGFYMLGLKENEQSFFVGIRNTFYRLSSVFGQGILVMIAGVLETRLGDIPMAWRITLAITALIFALITLYNIFFLPKPTEDLPEFSSEGKNVRRLAREFIEAFVSFFRKPGIGIAMLFLLLYRFPEALMLKLVSPFFLDSAADGGLGLSTETVGFIYGTLGVIALTIGGILGGVASSFKGLKKTLLPMALALTVPCGVYVYMAMEQPVNLWLIGGCVAIEQFGYGFGFTAYMLYMMRFSEGRFKTSHYAICTAFMALGMMIPGMFAGYVWKWVGGYLNFFNVVMLCCIATVIVAFIVKRDLVNEKK